MLRVGAEAALFVPHVNGDLLPAMIEQMHQSSIPTHPDLAAQIFGRRRVVGLGHFDVPVTIHFAPRFLEAWEAIQTQRLERWAFDFVEQPLDLLLGRAVNSPVGHGPFPIG